MTLLQLPTYGLLADTPGFNQPALEKLALTSVPDCFPEIRARLAGHVDEHAETDAEKHNPDPKPVAEGSREEHRGDGGEAQASAPTPAKCTFSNCTHRDEPGCVVRGDWERYTYYLDLYDEVRLVIWVMRRGLGPPTLNNNICGAFCELPVVPGLFLSPQRQ